MKKAFLLVFLFVVLPRVADAGVTLVQHVSKDAGTTTSSSLSFVSNNTQGNWLAVCIRAGQSGEAFSVSDSLGNVYRRAAQLDVTVDTPNGDTLAVFYAENVKGGPNTITVSESILATLRFAILEYSGVATANSYDVSASAQGTSATPNSGNATTTSNGDLLLGVIATANPATFTNGASFIAEERVPAEPSSKLFVEDRVQTSTGTISASVSLGSSDQWGALLASFKAGAGAALPSITSLSPTSGMAGTPVTISGANFGTTQGTSTVKFNGTAGTPTSWSATSIAVPVPSGATTGSVIVTVSGTASNSASFTVTKDTTPPVVTITAPSNNATVSGTITLAATATDSDSAVSFVQFQVDGANVGAKLASTPYSILLDTTALSNGSHTLTAVAQDPSANSGMSSPVPITVSNTATSSSTITLVQQAELFVSSGARSISQSFPLVSSAGNLIVATVKWGGQNLSIVSISDDKGNVYQSAAGPTNWSGTAKCAQTFYASNIAGGAVPITITVQLNGTSTGNLHLYQFEYSGVDVASPLDTVGAATGTGTNISAGPLTTRYVNDLIHAVTFIDTGTTMPGAGFQALTTYSGNLVENETAGAAGTHGVTATNSGGANWFMHAIAFKAASTGGTPTDNTPPVVTITAPANGATVSGTITLTATATDPDSAVSFVQFQVDGINTGPQLTTTPYSLSFDTTTVANGSHTLTALGQDPSGNQGTSAAVTITVSNSTGTGTGATGPLRPLAGNAHYFTDGSGKAILLSGSQTWNDFQDTSTSTPPTAVDFTAYVNFLNSHGHNVTILWKKDLPTYCNWGAGGTWHMAPFPWKRTGGNSGTQVASDGLPAFDLMQLDQTYFDRLRARVIQLQRNGIYAIVELFDGLGLANNRCSNDGYPFTAGNNVNGVDDGGGTNSMTMSSPNAVTNIQDAYVQKVIDTVNDQPNVLWEVSEEAPSSSGWWQGHMINLIHTYETGKPLQHPVGLPWYNNGDTVLYNANADWVAPSARISPTSSCGSGTPQCKVNINDSDHSYYGMWNDSAQTNRNYVWENFGNGNQVMFMDPYLIYWSSGNRNLCQSPSNGVCSGPDSRWDNMRNNLGYTVSYANKMDLAKMTPKGGLSSTGYCLAQTPSVGAEYLVYAPNGGSFTVNLSATTRVLNVEWFDPSSGSTTSGGSVSGGSTQTFTPPFSGDAVLYLVDAAGHN